MRLITSVLALAASALIAAQQADAAAVKIVALGASNTYGMGRGSHAGGVRPAQAWPSQLQSLLRSRGIDATVRNAGVPGDTTAGMLSRLDAAVPNGTKLVILEPGGNDARRGQGGQTAGNVSAITSRLAARGIKVIAVGSTRQIAPASSRDPDGQHFGAEGHAAVAAHLLPQVMSAVGGR